MKRLALTNYCYKVMKVSINLLLLGVISAYYLAVGKLIWKAFYVPS